MVGVAGFGDDKFNLEMVREGLQRCCCDWAGAEEDDGFFHKLVIFYYKIEARYTGQ